MHLYGLHDGSRRGADAFLTAIIEEAIDETVGTPAPLDSAEAVGAERFFKDAAAFLRARPDAADLLRRLQEIITVGATATDIPPPLAEPSPKTPPEVAAAVGSVEIPATVAPETTAEYQTDNL